MKKHIFGYRLSGIRRISGNGFGILANSWRVLRKPFSLQPEKVKMITLAAITLHNRTWKYLTYGKVYISSNLCDSEVPQRRKITEDLLRSDPPKESWYSLYSSKANLASKEANTVCE